MTEQNYTLEPWGERHRTGIIDIFNHYVENSFAAYLEEPVDYEFFNTFLAMARGYPTLAARTGDGETVGFAFLRPFHPFATFRKTAEIGYFIHPAHTRRGLGKRLLEDLIVSGRDRGVNNILANISSLNGPSLAFHGKNGFVECGCFRSVGRKFDRAFDLVWMQRWL